MGSRRRETLDIPVTPRNIKYAGRLRAEVMNAIERGTFDYAATFPKSKYAQKAAPYLSSRYKVGALCESYLATARKTESLSPSSIGCYARWYRARIGPQWGETWADELRTPDLRAWIADLVTELAPKSVRNCVGFLSVILSQATTDSVIKENPLSPISLKTLLPKHRTKEARDKIDPFNSEEISAILAACKTVEERAAIQFSFSTGVRPGELFAVKWPHVGRVGGLVHIEDNVVSAERGTVEKSTKTEGSERDIPLLPGALEALAAMRPISEIGDSYIFTHPTSKGRWASEQQYRNRWRIILRRAGVRYRNPYQTRHTFASTLLQAGEEELLVAKLMGHTTVEMVRRTYGRYIKRPEGVVMRGDYSKFGAGLALGADLGQSDSTCATLRKNTG